jgi:hypothetical protein
MKETFAGGILKFYEQLEIRTEIPDGVSVMHPFKDAEVKRVTRLFFKKYYNDRKQRTLILGINPGRFGAGITGITFTDPIRLEKECGIPNKFDKKQELSSLFIYEMINRYGGPEEFYAKYYFSAVSPLGFTRNGNNMNYYDDKNFERSITGFIVASLMEQIRFGIDCKRCICLGEGKNFEFLEKLNRKYNFFDSIIPLPHPRFIMQYRLRKKEEYLQTYLNILLQNPLKTADC